MGGGTANDNFIIYFSLFILSAFAIIFTCIGIHWSRKIINNSSIIYLRIGVNRYPSNKQVGSWVRKVLVHEVASQTKGGIEEFFSQRRVGESQWSASRSL